MGKRYLYTIQLNSETPEKIFNNVNDLVDYLNQDVDIYTSYMINNYFLQRNKKISKLISRLYKFTRCTNLPSQQMETEEL